VAERFQHTVQCGILGNAHTDILPC
jgi:hypothetical protein